jgi:DNA-binding XRE family transcriptional regulator
MRTQKELAQELGVTPQHLNAVLKGRVRPSLKLAIRISQATGIPVKKLVPELDNDEVNV